VLGHDGTQAADAALRLAEQCGGPDAVVLLARVVAPTADSGRAAGHSRRDVTASELAAIAARPGEPARVETHVIAAHSAQRGLGAIAEQKGADLIVVGSDRRPGDFRTHAVLGLRLLQGAPCAVAIAPGHAEPEIRHIGVG
jgi:nucleotide-binding universal stress UspA family protein